MTALTFVVPMPPRLTNRRAEGNHWRVVHREKTAYWAALDALQRCGRLPPPPAAPLPQVEVSSSMVLGGAMDDDNAMIRHKWLIDWLRTRGYIVDDRKRRLTWAGFPEQRVTRREAASITLTLTPAPP